jgi:hypothetical protein
VTDATAPPLAGTLAAALAAAWLLAALLAHTLLAEATWAPATLRAFTQSGALAATALLLRAALPPGGIVAATWAALVAALAAAWAPAGTRAVGLAVLLILLFAGALDALVARGGREPEAGTRATLAVLLLAGTTPLWGGPLAEQLGERVGAALLALSPLSLIAVLAGHDYLRDPWLYAHSAFGTLRVAYPGAALLACGYLFATGLLAVAARRPSSFTRSLTA